jgi:hypothetical protein
MASETKFMYAVIWPHKDGQRFILFHVKQTVEDDFKVLVHPDHAEPIPNSDLKECVLAYQEMGLVSYLMPNHPGVICLKPSAAVERDLLRAIEHLFIFVGQGFQGRLQ